MPVARSPRDGPSQGATRDVARLLTIATPCAALCVLLVGLAGCAADGAAGSPAQASGTLIDPAAWATVPEASSAFAARYPADASCSAGSMLVENGVLELNTSACDAITAGQAISRDVPDGAPMGLVFWHLALWAEEPATGVAGVAIGETVVWETTTPIPADPKHYNASFVAPRAFVAGESLQVFVTNHGANSWKLLDVFVEDAGAP